MSLPWARADFPLAKPLAIPPNRDMIEALCGLENVNLFCSSSLRHLPYLHVPVVRINIRRQVYGDFLCVHEFNPPASG